MGKKKVKAAVAATPETLPDTPTRPAVAAQLSPSRFSKVHYFAAVPLQLLGILFSLLNAAQSTRPASSPSNSSPGLLLDALDALIDRPLQFLPRTIAGVLVVQIYAGVTLRTMRRSSQAGGKKSEAVERKRGFFGTLDSIKQSGTPSKQGVITAIKGFNFDFLIEAIIITVLAAGILHCFSIALGAPFVTNFSKTALLSTLVSLLAITPIAIVVPITERHVWLRLLGNPATELESALMLPALGAIIGCWSGALPLPLDWGRPWQVWPTTSVVGTLAGHAVGSVISLILRATK